MGLDSEEVETVPLANTVDDPAFEFVALADVVDATVPAPVPDATRAGQAATNLRYLSSSAACCADGPNVFFGRDLTNVRRARFWAAACAASWVCLGLVLVDDDAEEDLGREEDEKEFSGDVEEDDVAPEGEVDLRSWKPAFVAALRSRRRMRARLDSGVDARPGAVAVDVVL